MTYQDNNYTIQIQDNPAASDVPVFRPGGFFFNDFSHLRQQSNLPLHLLTALNPETHQAEARCAFFDNGPVASSPGAAPFGSVEFDNALPDATLGELLHTLTDKARQDCCSSVKMVNYPNCYAPAQADRLTNHLLEQQYRVVRNDANFYLAVGPDSLDRQMHSQERRRLRKCQQTGFRFTHWQEPPITDVLTFLTQSRENQQYPLTLPACRLAALLTQFPDKFSVFTVCDGPNIASLAVTVRVSDEILYYFLPADNLAYRSFSPAVMLIHGLFGYCQQERIKLLDLGVSLDHHRQFKPSLARFKENLGAVSSPKRVFEKVL
jgi:Acetyltransferase (GNAT) domain